MCACVNPLLVTETGLIYFKGIVHPFVTQNHVDGGSGGISHLTQPFRSFAQAGFGLSANIMEVYGGQ